MEIKILKEEKDLIEFEVDNLTIAELLRVYLNEDSNVDFAAWKREHPSKNPVLRVETKGKTAKKAIKDAINKVEKDSDNLLNKFKKAVK